MVTKISYMMINKTSKKISERREVYMPYALDLAQTSLREDPLKAQKKEGRRAHQPRDSRNGADHPFGPSLAWPFTP